jgi:hypothetical protein
MKIAAKAALAVLALLAVGAIAVTVIVQAEGDSRFEPLGGPGPQKALVMFHPSRDAHFSDDLSAALSDGLISAGFSVDRATMTRDTEAAPHGYALIAIVCNTYWWEPDRPTQRYLARARLTGIPVIGLIGGAGATSRSQRLLEDALRASGAKVIRMQSLWLWRPNDEQRMTEANRSVALDKARAIGAEAGSMVLHSGSVASR